MNRIITAALLMLLSVPVAAQEDIDAEAFMAFQDICLRDTGQFEYAKDAAGDMTTAPEPQKSQLLDNRKGEVWISSTHPLIALRALNDGGCGINMKPVREDYLEGFLKAIPGQNVLDNDSVGQSWSKWFLIDTGKLKGILVAAVLDLNGEKSLDLRYLPSIVVLNDVKASDFLLLSAETLEKFRSRLK